VKRRVTAPDRRVWTVQLVWWPRPKAAGQAYDSVSAGRARRNDGQLFGLVFDLFHVVLWPVVLALRVAFRRPWLVEAFVDPASDGLAWKVRRLGAARAAVEEVANAIAAGTRNPTPTAGTATRFRLKYRPASGIF
jgi:hypothetical protein